MSERRLTPKQAIFVAEYLIDGNGRRAAAAAGFSKKGAHVISARLLRNVKVAAAIAEAHTRRAGKLEVTAERVLEELAKLAFYDPGDSYDADGKRIPVARLGDITRAAVSSVEDVSIDSPGQVRTTTQKLKLADKGQNLERLGRYLKLFTDRFGHAGRVTLESLVCGRKADEGGQSADS
jgi:phage terminase small subunit